MSKHFLSAIKIIGVLICSLVVSVITIKIVTDNSTQRTSASQKIFPTISANPDGAYASISVAFSSPAPIPTAIPLLLMLDKNNETKTYVSNKFNFSISYPDYFQVYEDNNRNIIAFYYGDNTYNFPEPYYCTVVHFEISMNGDGNCGSLAYTGKATKITETITTVSGYRTSRSDSYIQDFPLESIYQEINHKNIYRLSFYNGGQSRTEAIRIRSLLLKMTESFKLND